MNINIERLTDLIMERLEGRLIEDSRGVLIKGDLSATTAQAMLSQGYSVHEQTSKEAARCKYVLMPMAEYQRITGEGTGAESFAAVGGEHEQDAKIFDLTGKRLVSEKDLNDQNAKSGDVIHVSANAIVTAMAVDYANGRELLIKRQ